jgi:adenylate cyclase
MFNLRFDLSFRHHVFWLSILISFALSLLLPISIGVQELENRTWDWRVRLTTSIAKSDSNIKIIEIDQFSLDEFARNGTTWPWPRSVYVPIVDFLDKAGAKGLAFDMIFSEPSDTGASEDQVFADSLKTKLPILNVAVLSENKRVYEGLDAERLNLFIEKQKAWDSKADISKKYSYALQSNHFQSVTLPILEIIQQGKYFGNVSAEPDSDGVFRHYRVGGMVEGVPVLNSAFAFYEMLANSVETPLDLENFLDPEGRLTVRIMQPEENYSRISFSEVINSYLLLKEGKKPSIELDFFKDSWVFLGATAVGLHDVKPTSLNLHKSFVQKLSNTSNQVFSLFLILFITWVIFFVTSNYLKSLFLVLALCLLVALPLYACVLGYWLHLLAPMIVTFVAIALSFAFQYASEGRQSRFIRSAFRYYVSPAVVEAIIEDPKSLALGGEKRELTMFFADIVKFTEISEQLEANKLVSLINTFLTEMTKIIQQHGGTVDKFVGDAIVAFWNAPLSVQDHASRAVLAALECQKKLSELSGDFFEEYGVLVKMRIGINTGTATVGNFGSNDRFSYTVVGDEVNLASRLEGANKLFGTSVLVSQATKDNISSVISIRKIADIKVLGKSKIVSVYEPSLLNTMDKTMQEFNIAREEFERGNLEEALKKFEQIKSDPVAACYLQRINNELKEGNLNSWSPVWNLLEK